MSEAARRPSSLVFLAGLVAGAALVGCGGGPELFEGTVVRISSYDGIEPRVGEVDFLDRFSKEMFTYWHGTEPPSDFALRLELRAGDEADGRADPDDRSAWASGQDALLRQVVRLTVGWEDGDSAPAIAEGLAGALGTRGYSAQFEAPTADAEAFAFLGEDAFGPQHSDAATQLMRVLIQTYGLDSVRSLYQSLSPQSSSEEIEAAFVAEYGQGIYDDFDRFAGGPQCVLQAWECNEEMVPLITLPTQLSSDDTVALGSEGDPNWYPYLHMLVDVEAGDVLHLDGPSNLALTRVSCDASCLDAASEFGTFSPADTPDRVDAEWSPGRYYVVLQPKDPEKRFSVGLRR